MVTASTILLTTFLIELVLLALHATIEHNKSMKRIRNILDVM